MSQLDEIFDVGNLEGYVPPSDDERGWFEASTSKWETVEGKRKRSYEPRRIFRIRGAGRKGVNRFGDEVLNLSLTSVYPATKGAKLRVTVFEEIPRFLPADQVRANVMADERVLDGDKERIIEAKIAGLGRAKGRLQTLASALGFTDPRDAVAFLQTPECEGKLVAAALGLREWGEGDDKQRRNAFLRFYPVEEATEPVPEAEPF